MVIHMPLLDINMPSNANYVFSMLISIVTLDLFPSEDVLNALFTFPDQIPYNDRFDNLDIFQLFHEILTKTLTFTLWIVIFDIGFGVK